MRKKYFSEQVEKCERNNYAPCHTSKEHLTELLQNKAEDIFTFARQVLGKSFPPDFELPKIILLPIKKKQTFGTYAWNKVLEEETKLAKAREKDREALTKKLAKMKANVKVVLPIRGLFIANGAIGICYCNVCELCKKQGLDLEAYLVSVLVHEIFHAVQFASCENTQDWNQLEYWNGKGYEYAKVSTVRESLAEYFRYLWLRKQQQEDLLAIMMKDLSEPYATVPNFPYAGVKFLLAKEDVMGDKFKEIFEASLVNWQEAYEMLTS